MEEVISQLEEVMGAIGNVRDEVEDISDKLEDLKENGMILNIDNFKTELERQGLLTEELKDFIENYMTFDNES